MKIQSGGGSVKTGGENSGYEPLSTDKKQETKPKVTVGVKRRALSFRNIRSKKSGITSPVGEDQAPPDTGDTENAKKNAEPTGKTGVAKRKKLKKQLKFFKALLQKQPSRKTRQKDQDPLVRQEEEEENAEDKDAPAEKRKIQTEYSGFSGGKNDREKNDGDQNNSEAASLNNQNQWRQAAIDTQTPPEPRSVSSSAPFPPQNTSDNFHFDEIDSQQNKIKNGFEAVKALFAPQRSASIQVAEKAFDAFFTNGNTPKTLHEGLSACIEGLKTERKITPQTVRAVSKSLIELAKNLKNQGSAPSNLETARLGMMSGMAKTAKLLSEEPVKNKNELLPRLAFMALHVSEYAAAKFAKSGG